MAESSLSLGYPELLRAVGRFLGYGADNANWTTDERTEVDDAIKSGLRRFYGAHKWSFLRPVTTISTVVGTADYALPDGFASIVGPLSFAAGSEAAWTIELVPDLSVRKLRYNPRSGKPEVASVTPLVSDGVTGQRKQLSLYPTPDAVYVLSYAMQLLPDALSATNPYPLGGEQFAEVIVEACLAAAESTMDDNQQVHAERYATELALAIGVDNTHRSIDNLGYNGNGPTAFPSRSRSGTPTLNGVPITSL